MTSAVAIEHVMQALNAAHAASALRHNLSHEALRLATIGSGHYVQAITAAMMTLGGTHAPLLDTCYLLGLAEPNEWVTTNVLSGRKVPGWGNGFVKGAPDPLWTEVEAILREADPMMMDKVDGITQTLHEMGKRIYPNPSCYTAAASKMLGLPDAASPYLFVSARLPQWTSEFVSILLRGHA